MEACLCRLSLVSALPVWMPVSQHDEVSCLAPPHAGDQHPTSIVTSASQLEIFLV